MKKIILILLSLFLFAKIEGLDELMTLLLPKIVNKKIVKIYTTPKNYEYFERNSHFILVAKCEEADIVFGNILCGNKPVFALDYIFYRKNKSVFGVFYFRKGRPQIKFKKSVLLKYFHQIPDNIKDYTE